MEATLLKTNAGKGYKVVVNGEWMYTSTDELNRVITGKSKACSFRPIVDKGGVSDGN